MWRERHLSHLYDSHGQASFFRQLLPNMPSGLWSRREGRLQDLQLFRLYSGPWAASLRTGAAVAAATAGAAVRALVLRLAVPRLGIAVQGTFNRSKPSCRVTIVWRSPGAYFARNSQTIASKISRHEKFVSFAIVSFMSAHFKYNGTAPNSREDKVMDFSRLTRSLFVSQNSWVELLLTLAELIST